VPYEADFGSMVQRRTDSKSSKERRIRRVEVEEVTRSPAPVPAAQTEQNSATRSVHALIASEPLQWVTQPTAVVAPQPAAVATRTAVAAAAVIGATSTAVRSGQKRRRSGAAAAVSSTGGSSTGGGSSTSTTTATTATAVHKYELHGGPALNTSVNLDTVMFSLAAGLFERGMQPVAVAAAVAGAYGAVGAYAAGGYAMPYGYAAAPGYGYAMPGNNNNRRVQKVDVYCSAVRQAKYYGKRQRFAAQGISTAETWVFHGTPTLANVHSIMTEGFKVCCIV
jgi:hypothetical protein